MGRRLCRRSSEPTITKLTGESRRSYRRLDGVPAFCFYRQDRPKQKMQHVTGIGGFFFRAKDPASLSAWYKEHLGIDLMPSDYSQKPWMQEAGPTAFAPFPQDTDYFGNPNRNWMINFRVRDLAAMVEQLRSAKVEVSVDAESYPNGRFARLHDPDGNPIELWEPKG
jgi:glyoxylase I family protein